MRFWITCVHIAKFTVNGYYTSGGDGNFELSKSFVGHMPLFGDVVAMTIDRY